MMDLLEIILIVCFAFPAVGVVMLALLFAVLFALADNRRNRAGGMS
jgi:hypothetical protein